MVKTKRSKIHGRGLFADQPIRKGTLIGHLETKPVEKDGAYVLWLSETEAVRVLNQFRFINHSSRPNVAYYDDLTVVALKDIKEGDELVHNYNS
ncbi:SET domain-containing protein [Pleionea sediminis]|uniref:SET domain-containing protein n=1 Tax=Pleionea sediminis TaxID=2569479 RepID=UPI001FE4AEC8|nr:SET domain-containing methyltransferase [Pleionea sediminis]